MLSDDSVFVHSSAEVQTESVGKGTKVWQYSIILKGAKIGDYCNINAHCFIENDVSVGNNVTVKCGVQLWDGLTIEDDVFIGPNTTFVNDRYPRSKKHPECFIRTVVSKGASIGANSTILCGVKVGRNAMVGAGSVVVKDVPDFAVVIGNPAKVVRFLEDVN